MPTSQKIGGKADKRPTYHSGVVGVQLKGTTGCATLCIMIGTTPEVIKVPKGAVFIRVKGLLWFLLALFCS